MKSSIQGRLISIFILLLLIKGPLILAQSQLPIRVFSPKDPIAPLPGPAVTNLFQDQQGVIWMCIYGHTLTRFDGKNTKPIENLTPLCGTPLQVSQDEKGRLWVAGTSGIAATERPLQEYPPGADLVFTDTLEGHPLPKGEAEINHRILKDRKNNLWIPIEGDNIVLLHVRYGENGSLKLDSLYNPENKKSGIIMNLTHRKNGEIWAYSFSQHFLVFSQDSFHIKDTIVPDPDIKAGDPLKDIGIRQVFEDSEENLWLIREDDAITIWRAGEQEPDSLNFMLQGQKINDIIQSRDGRIWIAGYL